MKACLNKLTPCCYYAKDSPMWVIFEGKHAQKCDMCNNFGGKFMSGCDGNPTLWEYLNTMLSGTSRL